MGDIEYKRTTETQDYFINKAELETWQHCKFGLMLTSNTITDSWMDSSLAVSGLLKQFYTRVIQ